MPIFRVFATEKRFYHMEVRAANLLDALTKANRDNAAILKTEDVSQRLFTADEAQLVPQTIDD